MTQLNPTKRKIFANRNFRLLWAGQATSILGDQFAMIALPWLVLKLTGDPLALGTVLALEGVPRALFMLVGGAVTDRFSSRTIMLISDMIRLFLFTLLAVMVVVGTIHLWMLYALGLAFGLVSGFFNPASSSFVPQVVDQEDLRAGNALMQGTAQLSIFLGPVLAGGLIALFSHQQPGAATPDLSGIALAFAIDALTFLVSAVTLWMMKVSQSRTAKAESVSSILTAIQEGIRYVAADPALRLVYIVIAAANFLFVGPLLVGIPVLANTRLVEGAAAFGIIMSAYGGGNLVGIILGGSLPRLNGERMSIVLVGLILLFGVALAGFAFVTETWIAAVALLILGVGNGYLAITLISTLQERTPQAMLGRMMSLILFANVGLVPVSQTVSGALIKLDMNSLFIGAGILMALLGVWMAFNPTTRSLSTQMAAQKAG